MFSLTDSGLVSRNLASLAGSSRKNGCRKFHTFAASSGRRLAVKVAYVNTPVRKITKCRVGEVQIDFPTLPLSAWMNASFDLGGHFFLGGKGASYFKEFSQILHDWWLQYRRIDPTLPFFRDYDESEYQFSLPVAIHGDEGRGRYKRPIMIFSFQPLVSNFEGNANLKGPGFCPKSPVYWLD